MLTYTLIAFLVVIVLITIMTYNQLIKKRNEVDNSFGLMDVMLKKRYDLLPNLVEVVKQYMGHEASILSEITRLRSGFIPELSNEETLEVHKEMTQKLKNMFYSFENYPDIKANQLFLKLQASWNETEEQISASRRYFNTAVTNYNDAIQTFPNNLMAGLMNLQPKKVFETADSERKNISAKDLF